MEADASPSSSGEPTTRDTLIFSTADECFKKGPACAIENYTMSLRWNIFTFTYEISRPKVVKIHPCGVVAQQLAIPLLSYSCLQLLWPCTDFCLFLCYLLLYRNMSACHIDKNLFFFRSPGTPPLAIFLRSPSAGEVELCGPPSQRNSPRHRAHAGY